MGVTQNNPTPEQFNAGEFRILVLELYLGYQLTDHLTKRHLLMLMACFWHLRIQRPSLVAQGPCMKILELSTSHMLILVRRLT